MDLIFVLTEEIERLKEPNYELKKINTEKTHVGFIMKINGINVFRLKGLKSRITVCNDPKVLLRCNAHPVLVKETDYTASMGFNPEHNILQCRYIIPLWFAMQIVEFIKKSS